MSRHDEHERRTVYDLLPDWFEAGDWQPVGRLDRDSRGLLLFVREGWVIDRLTRPGACLKVYELEVRGHLQEHHVEQMLRGVDSPVGFLSVVAAEILGHRGPTTRLEVTLDEGRNRHLRRLVSALWDTPSQTPCKVLELKRVRIGPIELDVASGATRKLADEEVAALLGMHLPGGGR